ncbi:MAG: hypothetical protein WC676_07845 [Candidatus Omnitrophota bacterium]
MKDKAGQNTFEYILLLAAVVAVFIVFLNPSGIFRGKVERILNTIPDQVNSMARNIHFEE